MDAYSFDPFAICRTGSTRFERKIKHRSKYTHLDTLRHLFDCAEQSARYQMAKGEVALLVDRLQDLWTDYTCQTERMEHIQAQIEALGEELKAAGAMPALDEDVSGVTLFNMARLVGETGPLRDFPSKRALLRYAGLKLRERRSGQYRGQNRIADRLSAAEEGALPTAEGARADDLPALEAHPPLRRLLPREGEEGHAAAEGEGGEDRLRSMRKFLSMVYALAQSGERFDEERFRMCESQYHERRAA